MLCPRLYFYKLKYVLQLFLIIKQINCIIFNLNIDIKCMNCIVNTVMLLVLLYFIVL